MPTGWYNVNRFNKLRVACRTVRGEVAIVVLAGHLDPADAEILVDFLRSTLQAQDYRLFVIPSLQETTDSFEMIRSVLLPFVRAGRLLPFELMRAEDTDVSWALSGLEAYSTAFD
jgi:hypothetical protein